MTLFSTKRYANFLQIRLGACCWLLASLFCACVGFAQGVSDLYRGTWVVETPDNGELIIIVKRDARASYFWGKNADRTVYQGTWMSSDQAATITWADASSHVIKRDNLGFEISYKDPSGKTLYTSAGQQIPKEILGQWAKPPMDEDETTSDRDRAKGFFGIWTLGEDSSEQYMVIESDRSAASNLGQQEHGRRGSWAKQGSELHIAWDDGQYSILREKERGYSFKTIQSGEVIEDDETPFIKAQRTSEEALPEAWLAQYETERELQAGGIAFASRKDAMAFYRGTWLIKRAERAFEQIEIGRFGGLSTSIDGSLNGSWRMDGQDLFMRWDDGMRKVLGPIGNGFLIYEYKPSRPLDGVPSRIFPAIPADATKFAKYLEGRDAVARQILSLAEAAGIDPYQQNNGWGRTFSRWVWPFGDDDVINPDTILTNAYGTPSSEDPWWWPFWSEYVKDLESNQDSSEPKAVQATDAETAVNATATNTAKETPYEKSAKTKKESDASKKSWSWPF